MDLICITLFLKQGKNTRGDGNLTLMYMDHRKYVYCYQMLSRTPPVSAYRRKERGALPSSSKGCVCVGVSCGMAVLPCSRGNNNSNEPENKNNPSGDKICRVCMHTYTIGRVHRRCPCQAPVHTCSNNVRVPVCVCMQCTCTQAQVKQMGPGCLQGRKATSPKQQGAETQKKTTTEKKKEEKEEDKNGYLPSPSVKDVKWIFAHVLLVLIFLALFFPSLWVQSGMPDIVMMMMMMMENKRKTDGYELAMH
jgi:hypothetical protein